MFGPHVFHSYEVRKQRCTLHEDDQYALLRLGCARLCVCVFAGTRVRPQHAMFQALGWIPQSKSGAP